MSAPIKPRKVRWQFERVIGNRRYLARNTRSEVEVRIEFVGDESKYALMGYPKILGLATSVDQAHLEVRDEEIRP